MSQPIGFFGLRLTPGETLNMEVMRDFRITQVAFADEAKDGAKALVKVTYTSFPDSYSDDEEEEDEEDDEKSLPEPEEKTYTLCTLVAGRTEQERVDIQFCEEELVGFSITGDVAVDLIGNYVAPSDFFNQDPESDDEYDSDEVDEDDFDMADIDGMDEDDDEDDEDAEDRFEEIVDSTPAKKGAAAKKAIEAASASAKKRDASELDSPATALSKNQQKRLKKAEASSAASTPTKKDAAAAAASPASASKKEKVTEANAEVTKVAKDGKAKTATAAKKTVEKPSGQKLTKTKLPSGLIIEDKKAGEGPQAKAGMKVGMRYVGKLENGKVFDQCVKGKPFSFKLGRGEVIKGWDEGVKGMQVGSERRLTCPPKLAYGNQKIPGIPPNSTLIFDVKLVDMK